ncbi:MAG TPA: hypothetical protein VEA60_10745 [Allosphingosinicella sp.]|nr:hypothetical protein [Allosphingosinicella sp.]
MSEHRLLSQSQFAALAEATRESVQKHVIDTAKLFDPDDSAPAHVAAQMFFAQLSGVVTAAANGLAGAAQYTDAPIISSLRQGLHEQFDAAFEQALLMKGKANDG